MTKKSEAAWPGDTSKAAVEMRSNKNSSCVDSITDRLTNCNRLLRVSEAAAILGISRTQAYRLTGDVIPAIRIGAGCVRVHPGDLLNYISQLRERGV